MTTCNLGSCFDAFLHAGVHPSAFGFIQIGLSIFCMCSTSRSDSDWWFPSECGFELVLAAYLIHCIVASPSSWFTSVNAYFISISLLVSNDIEDSLHRSLVSLLTLNDLVSPTLTNIETACSKHSLKKNISSSLLNGLRCRLRYALPSTILPGRIPSHSW